MVIASAAYCGLEYLSLSHFDSEANLFWLSAFNGRANLVFTAVFWLGLLMLAAVWRRWRFHAAYLLAASAGLVMGGFWLLLNPTYLGTATLKGHPYDLTENYDWYSKWYAYSLCGCDGSGGACQCHNFYNAYSPIIPLEFSLTANDATSELEVRLNDSVLYIYGSAPRCYKPAGIIGYCVSQ